MNYAIEILEKVIHDIKEDLQEKSTWINHPEEYRRQQDKIKGLEEAIDCVKIALEIVKSNSVLGGVMICPKCENPHPHRYKEYWSCEECGEQWGEA